MAKEISDLVTFVIAIPLVSVVSFTIPYLASDVTKDQYINFFKEITTNKHYFKSIPKYYKDLK